MVVAGTDPRQGISFLKGMPGDVDIPGCKRLDEGNERMTALTLDMNLPGPDIPVVDAERLLAEFGGNQEILDELRNLFLEHAPPMYDSISAAIATCNADVLAKDAHSFKGACATYGAPRLSQVCKILELSAKAGDLDRCRELADTFKREYDCVFEELAKVSTEQ
ncbi:Hpt domain-containing protein [bacterium]|nr:Hpt domain-containing protein [bacterium]